MSERAAVLVSEAQADLKAWTEKPERFSNAGFRQYIAIKREYAEASNGHGLLRVFPDTGMSAEDYPMLKGAGEGLNGEAVLVDPVTLGKAFKAVDAPKSTPILQYVHLSTDAEGNPLLSATDLDNEVTYRQRKAEVNWPDTEQVQPRKTTYVFTLSAKQLEPFVKWALKHGENTVPGGSSPIRFLVTEDNQGTAVKLEIARANGEKAAEGLLMPVKDAEAGEQLKVRGREEEAQD